MLAASASVHLGWNPWVDLQQLLAYHFMVNAMRAVTISAVLAGVAGWFMVLRRQTFAGHTLSVVSFPGASAAVWLGISALWGYFGFCVVAAVVIAAGTRSIRGAGHAEESALVGVIQAFALAAGYLFVVLYKGFPSQTQELLFGTFLGVTDAQVLTLAAVAAGVLAVFVLVGRRLLFASVDPLVAASQGVPARLLGLVFLVALGLAVAEASQITGALLVFALLVMPSGAAQQLTPRPVLGIALSVALAVLVGWLGLAIAYFSPYPAGFWITTVGFAVYAGSVAARRLLSTLAVPAHRPAVAAR